jgi:hypothetical protein
VALAVSSPTSLRHPGLLGVALSPKVSRRPSFLDVVPASSASSSWLRTPSRRRAASPHPGSDLLRARDPEASPAAWRRSGLPPRRPRDTVLWWETGGGRCLGGFVAGDRRSTGGRPTPTATRTDLRGACLCGWEGDKNWRFFY